LLLGLGRHLERIFLWWPAMMLAAWVAGLGKIPLLGGYYAFFAAGALFAMMRERITLPALASLGATLFLALNGAVARAQATSDTKGIEFSPYVICGLIVAFYLFFFALNTRKGQALKLPASRLAGGLTYPIYLLHAHIGYMLLSEFGTEQNKAVAYVLVSAFVVALAYAVHELIERRLAGFWQAFFGRIVGRPFDAVQPYVLRGISQATKRVSLRSRVATPADQGAGPEHRLPRH
jgi:peptidoglycan/LPS O-acetylase OafA/YrhL